MRRQAKIDLDSDLWAGLMFVAGGVFFAVGAGSYTIGTPVQMGPGFFPMAVGIFIASLGLIIAGRAWVATGGERTSLYPVPLLILIASLCVFAAIAEDAGLAIATAVLVLLSATAGSEFRWHEGTLLGIVLSAFSVVIFVQVLGIPLRIWPAF